MPDAIVTAFVQQYKSNVELLMQQEPSRLRGMVTTDSYQAKAASVVEQFGDAAAQLRTQRHADTPLMSLAQDRRWVHPKDYEWATMVDNQDKLRMNIEPTGAYTRAGAAAMNRAIDDEILTAFFGTNYVGENGTTSETFNTTNYRVGVDVGGTASGLNVAKLQEAVRLLMYYNKGEIDEPIYAAISSYEHDSLLKEVQINNKDFGGDAVLVNGKVRRFMGIEFVITERLTVSSGNRLIPVWRKSGMHLGLWQDIMTNIDVRPDKSYATQVYLCGTFGATRLQAGKVIQILADDRI